MDWEAIGAIGEMVGAIGVILSLLYLAAQVLRLHSRAYRDFRFWDNAHFQYTQGLLTEQEWNGFRLNLQVLLGIPAYQEFWKAQGEVFSAGFRTEVDALLAAAPPLHILDAYRTGELESGAP